MTTHARPALGAAAGRWGLVALLLATLAVGAVAATATGPTVGTWATYRWTSSVTEEVPVLVRQEGQGGQVSWSIAKETAPPAPIFVTYSIVRGDARTYTLQIVTQQTADGTPLSVTQTQVERATGKALRSVIQRPKGVIETPESGFRPLREAALKGGAKESVTVPAGTFAATRGSWADGTVWVSDEVPALGLVKANLKTGVLELVKSGGSGAKDLLRS